MFKSKFLRIFRILFRPLRIFSFSIYISQRRYSEDFKFLQIIPSELKKRCQVQSWEGLKLKTGLKEGKGVVAGKVILKCTAVCNYGGHFIQQEYAEKNLLPFEKKCNFLLEMNENYKGKNIKFYLNHDENSPETFGKYLNHSKKHPNVKMRVYVDGDKLEVIFFTTKKVDIGEQLVWNYGSKYQGVGECVENCKICRLQQCTNENQNT